MRPDARKVLRIIFLAAFSLVAAALVPLDAAADTVSMRVVFDNPSSTEEKSGRVKNYLPPEIKKDDVVDTGGLEVDYDPASSLFYVYKDLVLKPKERVSYQIVVRDVWRISDEELLFVKTQVDEHLKSAEGKEGNVEIKALADKVFEQLSQIAQAQESESGDVRRRIEAYRVNKEVLKKIRANVILMKDFQEQAEVEADVAQTDKEIQFVITVKNASDKEPRKTEITRYLPEGVTPDLILDSQGFEARYDVQKKAYYVSKIDEFKPAETKTYVITILDRWSIPEAKLTTYNEEAKKLVDVLKETEYEKESNYLLAEVQSFMYEIQQSQSAGVSVKERISNYALNIKKAQAIAENVRELERMAEMRKEKERLNMTEAVIKKIVPNTETTWRIIYGTITFLAILSILTYTLWWGQTKRNLLRRYKDTGTPQR